MHDYPCINYEFLYILMNRECTYKSKKYENVTIKALCIGKNIIYIIQRKNRRQRRSYYATPGRS